MNKPVEQRFWEKVNKTDGCWEWTSTIGTNGYGKFWFNGKVHEAHRFIYEQLHGDIPDNICVCHSCDNPICVNPIHLWPGTVAQNVDDKVRKGRQNCGIRPSGVDYPIKLNRDRVFQIRALYATSGYSQATLGRMFNVRPATIGEIVRREIWKHV